MLWQCVCLTLFWPKPSPRYSLQLRIELTRSLCLRNHENGLLLLKTIKIFSSSLCAGMSRDQGDSSACSRLFWLPWAGNKWEVKQGREARCYHRGGGWKKRKKKKEARFMLQPFPSVISLCCRVKWTDGELTQADGACRLRTCKSPTGVRRACKGGRARAVGRARARAAERGPARRGAGGAGGGPAPTLGGYPSRQAGCEGAAETNCNTSHSSAHLFLMNA